jgi:WD40 repeat protein
MGPAIRANQGQLTSIAFNPTGAGVATAGENGTVKLWNFAGQQTGELIGHQGKVLRVCFRGDGALIAGMGADGTVRLWRPTGEQLAQFGVHVAFLATEAVGGGFGSPAINFSQDGQYIAVAEKSGSVRLWRIQNLGELLGVGCDWLRPFLASHPEAPRACG